MDWQTPVSLGIVSVTAALFSWRRFGRRGRLFEKHTGCGCVGGRSGPPPPGLIIRSRRGEAQQIQFQPVAVRSRPSSK